MWFNKVHDKQVIIHRTLGYGTKYGIGVFCLLETGEQQIDRVPKKTLNFVEKACSLTSFQIRIDGASCKKIRDTFLKITVSIIWEDKNQ